METLTKRGGIEGGPAVNDTPITGDDGLINAISDHHQVPLVLRNRHIFFINSGRHEDQEIPVGRSRVVRRRRNRLIDGGEISAAVLTDNDDVPDRNLVVAAVIGLQQIPAGRRLVDRFGSAGHFE